MTRPRARTAETTGIAAGALEGFGVRVGVVRNPGQFGGCPATQSPAPAGRHFVRLRTCSSPHSEHALSPAAVTRHPAQNGLVELLGLHRFGHEVHHAGVDQDEHRRPPRRLPQQNVPGVQICGRIQRIKGLLFLSLERPSQWSPADNSIAHKAWKLAFYDSKCG